MSEEGDGWLRVDELSGQPAGTGDRGPTTATDARRRQFLKAWAAPAAATAVAGCSRLGDSDDQLVEDLEAGDRTSFGGAMRFGESYSMTVTPSGTGDPSMTGRFDGPDRHLRYAEQSTTVDSYLVDGEGYVVADGECTRYPDLDAGSQAVESVARPEDGDDTAEAKLVVNGRTEIDDRTVLVLEPTDGAPTFGTDAVATYYVDESARYPRRIETAASVVEYRDWGAVGPIEPPDVDCRPADST